MFQTDYEIHRSAPSYANVIIMRILGPSRIGRAINKIPDIILNDFTNKSIVECGTNLCENSACYT